MKTFSQARSTILILLAVVTPFVSGCARNERSTGKAEDEQTASHTERFVSKIADKFDGLESFLNADDQVEIAVVHQIHQSILRDWYSNHGATVRRSQEALIDFLKTKNKKKAKQSLAQSKRDSVKQLNLEKQRLLREYESAVIAASPNNKLRDWQARKISQTILAFLEPLNLNEQQSQQVRDLAPLALKGIGKKEELGWHPIGAGNLEKLVGQQVIGKQQKQAFEELKKKNRTRKLKWAS